jgi:hypothetical protein
MKYPGRATRFDDPSGAIDEASFLADALGSQQAIVSHGRQYAVIPASWLDHNDLVLEIISPTEVQKNVFSLT